jgi:histidinol-phosphate phosphatase family protein
MARAVALLDRDGTINVDRSYVYRIEGWQLLPQVPQAICELRAAGYAIAVVTNQSAIAAGKYTAADVETLHAFMRRELEECGATIDAVVFCPHGSVDSCGCRKPRTGMARMVEEQLGDKIDYARSWMVGDKPSDIGFGQALGTGTVLLISRYWTPETLDLAPTYFADSLYQAVQRILAHAPL